MKNRTGASEKDAVEKLFEAKKARRMELAALPFEEKIKIVVELQKIAASTKPANENPKRQRRVWEM